MKQRAAQSLGVRYFQTAARFPADFLALLGPVQLRLVRSLKFSDEPAAALATVVPSTGCTFV